jgi:hypothetical protein
VLDTDWYLFNADNFMLENALGAEKLTEANYSRTHGPPFMKSWATIELFIRRVHSQGRTRWISNEFLCLNYLSIVALNGVVCGNLHLTKQLECFLLGGLGGSTGRTIP